jgi:Putative zinc-finger
MSELTHDRSLLGAYALGVLDAEEARIVEEHAATCAECRHELADLAEIREMLGEVPPEAFLDGPPEGGDLLLQRTLRRVRAEAPAVESARPRSSVERSTTSGSRWQRFALAAASIVAIAAAAVGSGFVIGRNTAPDGGAQPPPATGAPSVTATGSTVPGTFRVSGTDPKTGASLRALITPAAGWVRVHADVGGIRAGEKCLLIVRSRNGTPVIAGSWLVSPKGEKDGTTLDGSALVAATDVASIDVETFDGRKLISVPA